MSEEDNNLNPNERIQSARTSDSGKKNDSAETEAGKIKNSDQETADSPDFRTATNLKNITSETAELPEDIEGIPAVRNIENIERVEIQGGKFGRFASYFPHLVVGFISLGALGGLIYIIIVSQNKQADEAARTLITYLVAVVTVVIALILTLMAFFSPLKDFKERFSLGKEILTILIGVLGTIVGFYYGSANTQKEVTAPTPVANVSPATSITPPAAAATNFNQTRQQLAAEFETKGFNAILADDFETAVSAFGEAYKIWDDYHNVAEIRQILQKKDERFVNGDTAEKNAVWQEVFCEIIPKHQWGMSAEINTRFQEKMKNLNFTCGQLNSAVRAVRN